MNSSWKDLDVHGRRLNKILKILDKKFDKIPNDDIDGLARIAATIGNVTRQTIEIIKLDENYDEIAEWFRVLKQDEIAIKKSDLRELNKQNQEQKQEIQNQIERDKAELHDEKIARRQRQEIRL